MLTKLPYYHCAHANDLVFLIRKDKDLTELSSLGHFLKGSSATLGLTKVKVCEVLRAAVSALKVTRIPARRSNITDRRKTRPVPQT